MGDLEVDGAAQTETGARTSSGPSAGAAADETETGARSNGGVDESIYEMPGFVTFIVDDVTRSHRWYTEALGFIVLAELPGEDRRPALVHLRRHRYQDILLVPTSPAGENHRHPGGAGVRYTVSAGSEDLEARGARARAVRSGSVNGPARTAWNTVDLVCEDLDGHQVVFTQRVDPVVADEQFAAVVRASVRT